MLSLLPVSGPRVTPLRDCLALNWRLKTGVWGSTNNGKLSWLGTSIGTGYGIGGSAGMGYTWPVK
jgi:hypothetical protein